LNTNPQNTSSSKLAILAPYPFSPPRSGGHRAVFAYVKYLAQAWPGTFCITTAGNESLPGVNGVELFDDKKRKYVDPRVGWRVRRFLQTNNIQFLVLQHHYFGLLLWPFLWGLPVRVLVISHNLEYQRWRSLGKWWWPLMWLSERFVYRWAAAVAFISVQEQAAAPHLFGLDPKKCLAIPYPVDQQESPHPTVSMAKRQAVVQRHGWKMEDKLLLFFGPQNYGPNLEAVIAIVTKINPLLRQRAHFTYHILICGGGLPATYQDFSNRQSEGIHYLGFVPDIETYVAACDLVLNPIQSGGGVKTKLVEAVAYGKTVISYATGALGVSAAVYGEKLVQVPDGDVAAFAEAIIQVLPRGNHPTPASFFDTHYGPHAVSAVVDWLRSEAYLS